MTGLAVSNSEDSCVCTLLSLSDHDQLSEWSNFNPQTTTSAASKPNRPRRQQKSNKFGYGREERFKFQHHKSYEEYMKDYNEIFLKAGPYRNLYVNPVQYGGPYSQRPPVLRYRQNTTYTPVQKAVVEKETQPPSSALVANTTSTVKTLAETCRPVPHPPNEPRKLLSYEDIKDYIIDEGEDDVESKPRRYLKSRKPVDVNLTGKFLKRASGMSFSPPTNPPEREQSIVSSTDVSRSDTSIKYGNSSTEGPPKLAMPPKPAPSVNYKLPASLPYKVTARPPSQSARTERTQPRHVVLMKDAKFDDSLAVHERSSHVPFRLNAKQTTVSKSLLANSKSYSNFYKSDPGLSGPDLPYNMKISSLMKSDFSRNCMKTDKERKKQLQELVKILGQSTLTPYLQKLRGVESRSFHRSNPAVNKAELIDYSVVFGTRL